MKMKIEIDDETVDNIVANELSWHIDTIKKDLMLLRGKKKLENYQIKDKEYYEKLLPALRIVGDYFGVKK